MSAMWPYADAILKKVGLKRFRNFPLSMGLVLTGGLFFAWTWLLYTLSLFRSLGLSFNPALPFDQLKEIVLCPGLTGFFPFINPNLLMIGDIGAVSLVILVSMGFLCPVVYFFLSKSTLKGVLKHIKTWAFLGAITWILRVWIAFLPTLFESLLHDPTVLECLCFSLSCLSLGLNLKLVGVPFNLIRGTPLREAIRLSWKIPFFVRLGLIGIQTVLSLLFFYGTSVFLNFIEQELCSFFPPFSSIAGDQFLFWGALITATLVLWGQTFMICRALIGSWKFLPWKLSPLWVWRWRNLGDPSLRFSGPLKEENL